MVESVESIELAEISVRVNGEVIEGTVEETSSEPIEGQPISKIPTSFRTTAKPQILTEDDLEDFESKETYLATIKAGDTVKIFKLTDPIVDEPILDKYRTQYEAIAYKGASMTRLYRDRLDADFKVINSENFN